MEIKLDRLNYNSNIIIKVQTYFINRKLMTKLTNTPPLKFQGSNTLLAHFYRKKLQSLPLFTQKADMINERSSLASSCACRNTEPLANEESIADEVRIYGEELLRGEVECLLNWEASVAALHSVHHLAAKGLRRICLCEFIYWRNKENICMLGRHQMTTATLSKLDWIRAGG